ncbi:AI-2E family transporter [Trinickia terrae]|uniref:AI-2E family transporter n=1 Tax=Trinickia terrae TaxID=2571161 RepID=A0A4U1IFJ4_9BURK|nr:AI-2E family transporter [Trinickia terrae]TKC92516.1 AI-2E family transporter [Trinickia terrae]
MPQDNSPEQETDGALESVPSTDRKPQHIAAAVLYAALVLLALWVMRDFIPAVAWAGVIAIALWPLLTRLEARSGSHKRTTLVAIALTAAVGLLIVLPFVLVFAQAVSEMHDFIAWLREAEATGIPVPDFVAHLPFGSAQVASWWQDNLALPLHGSPAMKALHGDAVVTIGRRFGTLAAHGLVVFSFTLVTLFVMFQAGPRLSCNLLKGTRRAFGSHGALLAVRMAAAVRSTVSGLVVVGLGEGAFLGIAYLVSGVPHAAVLGLLTAIAAMLPFCAPLVFCGAALWLFAQGAAAGAIGVAVFGFIVVFIAEHFVRPLLIGGSTRLPFLLVLFGILGGAQTFGFLGLFIGPALMTVLTVLWSEWVR